jgi:transposase-like protein
MIEEYPRNLLELEAMFSTEEACRAYLARLRWPEGFHCPRCGNPDTWPVRKTLLQCKACKYQTSVTAGTIFQDTRTPLTVWFRAMWWVTTQKNGASALSLQRILGLKSYETAWAWLHKLRRAMIRPGRDLLTGRVEVDECYIGGPEDFLPGRLNLDKTLVVVAAQEDGPGIGRIRLRQIPDASAASLIPFVQESVELGSVIHTDGWLGYSPLEGNGFDHEVTFLKGKKKSPSELMPRVHLVISLLKRWLMGTHQGAVSHKHLDYYLDEFTFRFNRRRSQSRGKLFYRLAQQAVAMQPVPLDHILHPDRKKSRKLPTRSRAQRKTPVQFKNVTEDCEMVTANYRRDGLL